MPEDWVKSKRNLGKAYNSMGLRGLGTGNFEKAIEEYRNASEIASQTRMPYDWSGLQISLGNSLSSLGEQTGQRKYLDEALYAYEAALKVRSKSEMPSDWALIKDNIGNVLSEIGEWEGGIECLTKAVEAYRDALGIRSLEKVPLEYAATHYNLAGTLRLIGSRTSSIEYYIEAINSYKIASQVYTKDKVPKRWADIQDGLGNCLQLMGIRTGDFTVVEEAIKTYEAALSVYDERTMPAAWAGCHQNRGSAFVALGERRINTFAYEQAIKSYQLSLTKVTRKNDPLQWANLNHNIGNALQGIGVRQQNTDALYEAVDAYSAALEVRNCTEMPSEWATTLNNKANTLLRLGKKEDNIKYIYEAVECFEAAIKAHRNVHSDVACATVLNNASIAYIELGNKKDDIGYLERAYFYLKKALEVRTKSKMRALWAESQNNLGIVSLKLGFRESNSRYMREAVEAFTSAIFCSDDSTKISPEAEIGLAKSLSKLSRWSEAVDACHAAFDALDRHFGEAETVYQREDMLRQVSGLGTLAACAAVRAARYDEALVALERGRAVQLREALALDEARLAALDPALADPVREARARLFALRAALSSRHGGGGAEQTGQNDEAVLAELRQARAALDAALAAAGLGPTPPPVLADLLAAIPPGGALLVPVVDDQGGFVFVVPTGTHSLDARHAVPLDLDAPGLRALLQDWLGPYRSLTAALAGHAASDLTEQHGAAEAALAAVLAELGMRILAPACTRLAELGVAPAAAGVVPAPELVVMPVGDLALLPVQAATWDAPEGPRCLLDGYAVSLTPSLATRRSAGAAGAPVRALCLCALIDPDGLEWGTDGRGRPVAGLPFARTVEGPALARLFAGAAGGPDVARLLTGDRAGLAALQAALRAAPATHLHLACHGFYAWDEPARSGLILAGHDRLRVRDLVAGLLPLSACRLAVLSACETGISDVERIPDEAAGLVAAFLTAGVQGVVATLWAVADDSTALFMARLYRLLLADGLAPAQAVRAAALWLRDLGAAGLERECAALEAQAAAWMEATADETAAAAEEMPDLADRNEDTHAPPVPMPASALAQMARSHATMPARASRFSLAGKTAGQPDPGMAAPRPPADPAADPAGAPGSAAAGPAPAAPLGPLRWAAFTAWGT